MAGPSREHILLTVLGNRPTETTYEWEGRSQRSTVAPAALYALLSEAARPDRVLALCTPEAERTTLPALTTALEAQCPVEPVSISLDPTDHAIHAFLATLVERVPRGADLTVDVTHGPRHLVFVAYAALLYLTAMRGVRLRAAYYGLLSQNPDTTPSAFMDVQPLVELPQWFHALRVLADTGSAHAMAELVENSDGHSAAQVGKALRTLSEAYASGLPIELGYLARQFLAEQVGPLRDVLHDRRLPLADELVREFSAILKSHQLVQDIAEPDWKPRVILDRAELERQARIIDEFLDRCDYRTAFGLMREWLVLWAMWRTGDEGRWLDYHGRKGVESRLNRRGRSTGSTADQAMVVRVLKLLRELRNPYAHHGLDKNVNLSHEHLADSIEQITHLWRTMLRRVPESSVVLPPPQARVLVSPLGMRPGVLYSALLADDHRPVSRCLVICSSDTEGFIQQACEKAGYSGEVMQVRLDDPFAGVAELPARVREAKRYLPDDAEIIVNVTGGTTLMGVLAERIANSARGSGQPVHRFALIDRRPTPAQDADPYQRGEVCWLDDPPKEEAG